MYMIKYKLFSFGGSVVLDLVETYPKAVAIKLFVSMYVCIYVYIWMYMWQYTLHIYIYVYIYIYIYIYMYIAMRTQTFAILIMQGL